MISGGFNITLNYIPPGAFCWINGFIGQWTVQVCDFSTLAIALVTFFVLKSRTSGEAVMASIAKQIWYIIGLIWFIPLCTAIAAQLIIGYGPTGSNWCWIPATPLPKANYARYGLTHGPRIAIFLTILFTYTYVFITVRKRYLQSSMVRRVNTHGSLGNISSIPNTQGRKSNTTSIINTTNGPQEEEQTSPPTAPWARSTPSITISVPNHTNGAVPANLHSPTSPTSSTYKGHSRRNEDKTIEQAIYRLMLYPSAYILLWLGGMINRGYDAAGTPNQVTLFLQTLTQFLPFVDCIIYGFTVRKAFMERSKLSRFVNTTFMNRSKDKSSRKETTQSSA
ncbi:hypothetical protein HK102_008899 [Quaeritorhiza haematococci]|nr:hypothetical protein HK102_008899 [Quaeritorhiza haematococci]